MLIYAAPLRVSFVGGGSDLPSFYSLPGCVGRVISAAIDKFVVISLQHTPLCSSIKLKYSETEEVEDVDEIRHSRLREALRYFDVRSHVEIASLADLPGRIGLGASSAFAVALVSVLAEYKRMAPGRRAAIADLAFYLETVLVGETLGKQDQYASAFGGANIFQFDAREPVVRRIQVDFELMSEFWSECCTLVYLGSTHSASTILEAQSIAIASDKGTRESLQLIADDVWRFHEFLLRRQFDKAGQVIFANWWRKANLVAGISTPEVDDACKRVMCAGASGVKLLGAGEAGCLLIICRPSKRQAAIDAVFASAHSGVEPKVIQASLTSKGVEKIL